MWTTFLSWKPCARHFRWRDDTVTACDLWRPFSLPRHNTMHGSETNRGPSSRWHSHCRTKIMLQQTCSARSPFGLTIGFVSFFSTWIWLWPVGKIQRSTKADWVQLPAAGCSSTKFGLKYWWGDPSGVRRQFFFSCCDESLRWPVGQERLSRIARTRMFSVGVNGISVKNLFVNRCPHKNYA